MSPPRIAAGAAIALLAGLAALPSRAQTPSPGNPPAPSPPATSDRAATDLFGQEITLPQRRIVYLKGAAQWETAFATLVDAFKAVYDYLKKEDITPAGPVMAVYTQADVAGFEYMAAVPIVQEPKVPPQGDLQLGDAPSGKALKFVHRGPYDAMDVTYEAITNYLDEKRIEAGDMFIEEYRTDPTRTPEKELIVHIYVPTK